MDLVVIRGRAVLVKTRTQLVNSVRGIVKSFGYRMRNCSTERFGKLTTEVPEKLRERLAPLMEVLEEVQKQIEGYDQQVEKLAKEKYPETTVLQQIWGVGEITSVSYVLTIEDKGRFEKSRDVGPYLGLRPRRSQSVPASHTAKGCLDGYPGIGLRIRIRIGNLEEQRHGTDDKRS
jgi:transposase